MIQPDPIAASRISLISFWIPYIFGILHGIVAGMIIAGVSDRWVTRTIHRIFYPGEKDPA